MHRQGVCLSCGPVLALLALLRLQADTGTKMVHVGKNTRSRIVSKGISAGNSVNAYRGLVQVQPTAAGARNYSQCDSMLIGDKAGANTYPYIQVHAGKGVIGGVFPGCFQGRHAGLAVQLRPSPAVAACACASVPVASATRSHKFS